MDEITRPVSYYVSLPLSDYISICDTIRELLGSVYEQIPLADNDGFILVDTDGVALATTEIRPGLTQVTTKFTSDKIPAQIHKIAGGID